MKTSKSIEFAGQQLTFETGHLAERATSSILARLGDTVVLVTVVEGGKSDLDYFPLSVEYIERLYAGGKIKGSRWVKREGRPSDNAVLTGRVIDRSIRPLFPKSFKNAVQIIITVLSVDGENEPDILALNAVSAAIAISRIPWNGPIGAIRMGYNSAEGQGTFIANPTSTDLTTSELDIIISQTAEKTVMIEAGASQVTEDIVADSVVRAHAETQKMITAINELVSEIGQEKLPIPQDADLTDAKNFIEKSYKKEIEALIEMRVSEGGSTERAALLERIVEDMLIKHPNEEIDKKLVASALEYVEYKIIREALLTKKKRPDGRKLDEIRPITIEVGILPRTHGSALFQRGMTQALSIVTLGSPRMEQLIESAEGEETKRYIHHYSGLPYSFGQAGRVGSPGRREVGHGALAERALEAVIPTQAEFPYTIMIVSEVLSQNGSSSMASTCGSTLALLDAGVPIKKPVAGISIGMMSDEKSYELLTDIIGVEDFSGDMDFKVAGTDAGITAIQLDVKIPGLTDEQVTQILARAKSARMQILEKIAAVLPQPRAELSMYAPKITNIKIAVDKIGELIGPGGKMIKSIIAQTGAQVDVEDDGTVTVSGVDQAAVTNAVNWISGMMREVQPGEIFDGEVMRILPFGAFVELLPGKEGMVHVSKMAHGFVKSPDEVVKLGQIVKVKVLEIDDQGRINLTMLLDDDGSSDRDRSSGPSDRGGDRGGNRPPRQDRPVRSDRGGAVPFRRTDAPAAPSTQTDEHPLSRQLKRERFGDRDQRSSSRSTTSGPRRNKPRFNV